MLYQGPRIRDGDVALVAPEIDEMRARQPDPAGWGRWLERALEDESILYFGITWSREVIGEIFIHDITDSRDEGMLGYHIFNRTLRGQGIGGISLHLLLNWISTDTAITRRLVATGEDNPPSQRMLERAGMILIGRLREDTTRVLYRWATGPL